MKPDYSQPHVPAARKLVGSVEAGLQARDCWPTDRLGAVDRVEDQNILLYLSQG
jgi:hypothetical protein